HIRCKDEERSRPFSWGDIVRFFPVVFLEMEMPTPIATIAVDIIAGTATDGDAVLVNELKQRLSAAGLSDAVTWSPNIDHDEKTALLESFCLFSVPATYPEAFGLYTIEALAAGTPLVMPGSSSFPEIVRQSDAGRLSKPQDPVSLAETWHDLLNAPDELQRLSENARRAAEDFYSVEAMRERFLTLAKPLTESSS
ncbi:MAG: glycosyltransferase, partial [Haloferula sp.]